MEFVETIVINAYLPTVSAIYSQEYSYFLVNQKNLSITAMPLSRHLSVLIVIIAQIQSIHILKAQSLENDDCAFSYSSSINSITSSTRQCSSLQSRAIVLVETLLPFLIE